MTCQLCVPCKFDFCSLYHRFIQTVFCFLFVVILQVDVNCASWFVKSILLSQVTTTPDWSHSLYERTFMGSVLWHITMSGSCQLMLYCISYITVVGLEPVSFHFFACVWHIRSSCYSLNSVQDGVPVGFLVTSWSESCASQTGLSPNIGEENKQRKSMKPQLPLWKYCDLIRPHPWFRIRESFQMIEKIQDSNLGSSMSHISNNVSVSKNVQVS